MLERTEISKDFMLGAFALLNNIVKYFNIETSGYATSFTAGGAIRIAHYDVIDDLITRKL